MKLKLLYNIMGYIVVRNIMLDKWLWPRSTGLTTSYIHLSIAQDVDGTQKINKWEEGQN